MAEFAVYFLNRSNVIFFDRLCESCSNMQVIIFDYAIVNMRRSCCDLKRSMDCGASATGNRMLEMER
jgi:hypothetical protein